MAFEAALLHGPSWSTGFDVVLLAASVARQERLPVPKESMEEREGTMVVEVAPTALVSSAEVLEVDAPAVELEVEEDERESPIPLSAGDPFWKVHTIN